MEIQWIEDIDKRVYLIRNWCGSFDTCVVHPAMSYTAYGVEKTVWSYQRTYPNCNKSWWRKLFGVRESVVESKYDPVEEIRNCCFGRVVFTDLAASMKDCPEILRVALSRLRSGNMPYQIFNQATGVLVTLGNEGVVGGVDHLREVLLGEDDL